MLFIADGRFHMEAAMIANPDFTTYQYNPYTKVNNNIYIIYY